MKPDQITVGMRVRYYPSLKVETNYGATVADEPWRMDSGRWVVRLKDLDEMYVAANGGRTHITAAALENLKPERKAVKRA